MQPETERLAYSIREVAALLGIAFSTAQRWVYNGTLPSALIARRRMIPADELYRLLHPPEKTGT